MTGYEIPQDEAPMQRVVDTVTNVTSHVKKAVEQAKAVVDDARRPGQPLDALSEYARKSPLTALGLAFLVGVAFAGRR